MPRTYIRTKPELAPVTEQQLARAKQLIRNGISKRAAATVIGISESCLRKRLKLDKAADSMGRFMPTFNNELEEEDTFTKINRILRRKVKLILFTK